jgi:hypothetical protein
VSLSELPDMFSLNELAKGYFPHYFASFENMDYVGPYPPKECYWYDFMYAKKRDEFIKWHNEKLSIGVVFNFRISEKKLYLTVDLMWTFYVDLVSNSVA